MSVAGIVASIIFLIMFVLIVMDKIERQYVTLGCGFAMLVIVFGLILQDANGIWEILNLKTFATPGFWYSKSEAAENGGINWQTIVFIAGMMVMVEGMARVGFFRWLCMKIAKLVKYKTMPLLIAFMIMAAVLSMFIDSITVILFLAAVTIELSQILEFNPVSMIIGEIFCANLGGAATMCGDPPNIIIGTSLGLTFFDFLLNTGLISLISMVLIIYYFYLINRKKYGNAETPDVNKLPDMEQLILDKKGFVLSCFVFGVVVVLLITHATTGITVSTIGVIATVLTLIFAGRNIPQVLLRVDYHTLTFFIGLFVVVGGLEKTGVLEAIAGLIEKISGDNLIFMILIIIWFSAVASAFVDNIPFSATMIPIIETLSTATGLPLETFAWALSIGTDIGGNATPIGASANVVGISVSAKAGHPIGWKEYCKAAVPATVIVLATGSVIIVLRYLI